MRIVLSVHCSIDDFTEHLLHKFMYLTLPVVLPSGCSSGKYVDAALVRDKDIKFLCYSASSYTMVKFSRGFSSSLVELRPARCECGVFGLYGNIARIIR